MKSTRQSVTRIAAFVDCGVDGWILQSAENPLVYRYATNACHDRLCVPCAADRSRIITSRVLEILQGQAARFVTLTLRGGETDLAFGIWRIQKAFRRLRQRKFWQARVKGGVFFVEFKWSSNSLAWHVHLHIICHGRYVPKDELSREWHKVTGDSYITDVRFVRSESKIARYVAKYVTKPWDRTDAHAADRLAEIVSGTHRRRLIGGFGDWRHITLTERPETGEWIVVGDVETLAERARGGDFNAVYVLSAALQDAYDHLMDYVPEAMPPPTVTPKRPPSVDQLAFAWIDPLFTGD